MTDRDRRRRVVLLCISFARNLAYYLAGQSKQHSALVSDSHPHAPFWRQVNTNCLDICVLEWCKLLGDRNAEHHWSRVVSEPARFEAALLQHLGIDSAAFAEEVKAMRHYRDRFVAHLDKLPVMSIPWLETAKASVWFYHGYLVTHEAKPGELAGLPDTTDKLTLGYEQCVSEAEEVFSSR